VNDKRVPTVSQSTVRGYPRRLAALQRTHAPEIERAIIHRARDAALSAAASTQEAIDLERKRIAKGEVRDAAASAQKLSITEGVQVDKALVLEGRPSQITQHRPDLADIFAELKERVPGLFVDSWAVEEPEPPELPPAA
jgi:hypothetical protein